MTLCSPVGLLPLLLGLIRMLSGFPAPLLTSGILSRSCGGFSSIPLRKETATHPQGFPAASYWMTTMRTCKSSAADAEPAATPGRPEPPFAVHIRSDQTALARAPAPRPSLPNAGGCVPSRDRRRKPCLHDLGMASLFPINSSCLSQKPAWYAKPSEPCRNQREDVPQKGNKRRTREDSRAGAFLMA